jgi:hypothetical protein
MDQSSFINSDPSILLLNEIEILLAQTRLMELYLKQAQATAANETARSINSTKTELASLRASPGGKEKIFHQLSRPIPRSLDAWKPSNPISAQIAVR